jgi:hypothetical protein
MSQICFFSITHTRVNFMLISQHKLPLRWQHTALNNSFNNHQPYSITSALSAITSTGLSTHQPSYCLVVSHQLSSTFNQPSTGFLPWINSRHGIQWLGRHPFSLQPSAFSLQPSAFSSAFSHHLNSTALAQEPTVSSAHQIAHQPSDG